MLVYIQISVDQYSPSFNRKNLCLKSIRMCSSHGKFLFTEIYSHTKFCDMTGKAISQIVYTEQVVKFVRNFVFNL